MPEIKSENVREFEEALIYGRVSKKSQKFRPKIWIPKRFGIWYGAVRKKRPVNQSSQAKREAKEKSLVNPLPRSKRDALKKSLVQAGGNWWTS